jgi:hypothetical protein
MNFLFLGAFLEVLPKLEGHLQSDFYCRGAIVRIKDFCEPSGRDVHQFSASSMAERLKFEEVVWAIFRSDGRLLDQSPFSMAMDVDPEEKLRKDTTSIYVFHMDPCLPQ